MGAAAAQVEWRSEDHPVAGVLLEPERRVAASEQRPPSADGGNVLFYIHHAVKGMSVRAGAVAHVAQYSMPVARLRALTRAALTQLADTSASPSMHEPVL